jgi:hypothetical protein
MSVEMGAVERAARLYFRYLVKEGAAQWLAEAGEINDDVLPTAEQARGRLLAPHQALAHAAIGT